MNASRVSSLATAAVLAFAGVASADLITNGNFSAGNTGFTSAYAPVPPGDIYLPATYEIVSFNTGHSAFTPFYDHTSGNASGRYMAVNGTNTGLAPAWAQTVNLTAGNYNLSAWFASLVSQAPASLQFHIVPTVGSSMVSSTFFAPSTVANWAQSSFAFNIATTGSYSIQIWDTNQAFSGNDYAIDDISLTAVVPLPPAAYAGLASLAGIGAFGGIRRKRNARA